MNFYICFNLSKVLHMSPEFLHIYMLCDHHFQPQDQVYLQRAIRLLSCPFPNTTPLTVSTIWPLSYRLALPLLQWNHKVCILLYVAYFSQYYACESSMLHETVAPSVQCFTVFHCLYVLQCIYSTLDGHLQCFQFLAIIEKAMYSIVQVF